MYQSEIANRIPIPLSHENGAQEPLDFQGFSCSQLRVLSVDGASGLVYEAVSEDYYKEQGAPSAKLIVKECYPIPLASRLRRSGNLLSLDEAATKEDFSLFESYIKRFTGAFSSHASLYQSAAREQIVVPNKALFANGTAYLISDSTNGDVMTIAFKKMPLSEQIQALVRVTEAISAIHEAGYVYLDLKPDNILCIRNSDASSNRFYTGEIKLFDFDTATSLSELKDDSVVVSGSGGWSSHEQTHPGYREQIGFRSDFYAIGSILFWMAIGRPPKTNEVIHADGKWSISGRDCINPALSEASEQVLMLLRKILNNTLTVDPSLRYSTSKPLIDDLVLLQEFVKPVSATQSSNHAEEMRALNQLIKGMKRLDSHLSNLAVGAGSYQEPNVIVESDDEKPDNSIFDSPAISIADEEPPIEDALSIIDADDDLDEPALRIDEMALAGYEVTQMLDLLADGFNNDLSDECQRVLHQTSTELKTALSSRNYTKANTLISSATEMTEATAQLVTYRMMHSMADNLKVSVSAISAVSKTASALEQAIVQKDANEMFWRRAELEVACEASSTLAEAGVFKDALANHLSEEAISQLDAAVALVEQSLAGCNKDELEKSRNNLKKTIKHAEQDMYARLISDLF